jgi:hypothetical protein
MIDDTLYPTLIDVTYEVLQALTIKPLPDYRFSTCIRLTEKILSHSATILHLDNGTTLYLSRHPKGAYSVDFQSVNVLARAILETYLKQFEVFFDPKSEDEFEYRYNVYQLDGFRIRERTEWLPRNPNSTTVLRAKKIVQDIADIRKRIEATQKYKNLDVNQKKASLNGKICPHRNFSQIAKDAGFSLLFIERMYAYLSGYAHGDSLSVAQIAYADTEDKKRVYVNTAKGTVMTILSKLLLNLSDKFPEAKTLCDSYPEMIMWIKIFSNTGETLFEK